MMDDLTRNVLEQRDNIENQRNRELNSNREEYIKQLQQENQALKNTIKRCYTPEEIDFEIMPVKAELQAEKDINNNLHKTIDKLRVNLYEIQQENKQLKDRINKAIDYIEECESFMFGIRENDEFVWKDTETKKDLLEILKGNNNEL